MATGENASISLDEYPVIHGIRTHVIKYGLLKEKSSSQQKLALIIPGNPGAVDFYREFMSTLHEKTGWPVWGLSHAGHSGVPSHIPWKKPNSSVFTLEGQIQHKVSFINEYIPDNVEILLIGHSIGAYVVLQIMDRIEQHKLIKGMLLFPTIERMAISPRGTRMTPILRNFRWFLIFISFWLSLLPLSWKKNLISWVINKRSFKKTIPNCINAGILHLLNPYCVMNAMYMAHVEMGEVDALDEVLIARHIGNLYFYYGATDHWCPVNYYQDMKRRFPSHENIHLCEKGFRHAFIIDTSRPMGELVSEWMAGL